MTTENIREASEAPLVPGAEQTAQPGDAHAKRPADNTSVKEPADKINPESEQTAQPGDAHANRPADQHIGESVAAFKSAIAGIEPVRVNMTESMAGLLTNAGLTEEFGAQVIEIFEAAVADIAKEYVNSIAEAAGKVFEDAITAQLAEMEATVEATVAEAVTEWMAENRIALEESATAANNNNLVESMIQLIESHGYQINPAEVTVAESAEVVESQDTVLAEQVTALVEDNNTLRKALTVASYTRSMSDLQAEKITSLAESLEFVDEESFAAKLGVLSEHFVNNKVAKLTDEGLDAIVEEEKTASPASTDPYINAMVSTIGKYVQK